MPAVRPQGNFREWDRETWLGALDANMLTPIKLMKAGRRDGRARLRPRLDITSTAVKAPIDILGLSNGVRSGLTGFVARLARTERLAVSNVTVNNLLAAFRHGTHALHAAGNCPRQRQSSAAVALLASFMLSLPSLRISGDYLLVTSIGFQLGLLEIIKNIDVVGGASGPSGIPNVVENHRSLTFAALSLAVALACVLAIRALVRSPFGRAIQAMRDDELVFSALGRNAMNIKMAIFATGCGMAGLAGGIYAYYYQYVTPDQFLILPSAMILTMVVVGGMGSVYGPVIGAVLLIVLPEAITFLKLPDGILGPLQGVIFTLLVILLLFLRPQGLVLHRRKS